MNVDVQFGSRFQRCILRGEGFCKFCGGEIIWAILPSGKFIPLDPDPVKPGVLIPHFRNCAARRAPASTPGYVGIEMSEQRWKQLVRLVHPDKHHGGEDERVANDVTQWLMEQRRKVKKQTSARSERRKANA